MADEEVPQGGAFPATVREGGPAGPTDLETAEAKVAGLEQKIEKQKWHVAIAQSELKEAKAELADARKVDKQRRAEAERDDGEEQ